MQPTFSVRWLTLVAALLLAIYLCWRLIQPFLDVPALGNGAGCRLPAGSSAAVRPIGPSVVGGHLFDAPCNCDDPAAGHARHARGRAGTAPAGWHSGDDPIQLLNFDSPILGPLLRRLDRYVNLERFQSEEFVRTHLETGPARSRRNARGGRGTLAVIVQMFLVVFTMFYLFRDGDAIKPRGI